MRALSPRDILHIWERGPGRHPVDQALAILAPALPEFDRDALADISIGQRDARILALRGALLGDRLDGYTECPSCGTQLEFSLSARELGAGAAESAAEGPQELSVAGYELRFRLPTSRDLAAACSAATIEEGAAVLLSRCVQGAWREGLPVPVEALPEEVVDALAARMVELEPLSEIQVSLRCESCAYEWEAELEIASFFCDELAVRARRLLRDIHTLAGTYGWSEEAILALSEHRRQHYLELVGA